MNIDLNMIPQERPARVENMSERAYIATHMLAALVNGRAVQERGIDAEYEARRAVRMTDALLAELAK